MKFQKLPDFLFCEEVKIKGHKTIDEDGEAIYEEYKGKCMSKTTYKRIFQPSGKVDYCNETKIILKDDINFDCYGGKAYIDHKTLNIVSSYKDNDKYTVLICN